LGLIYGGLLRTNSARLHAADAFFADALVESTRPVGAPCDAVNEAARGLRRKWAAALPGAELQHALDLVLTVDV
jgi:hypothetical protein